MSATVALISFYIFLFSMVDKSHMKRTIASECLPVFNQAIPLTTYQMASRKEQNKQIIVQISCLQGDFMRVCKNGTLFPHLTDIDGRPSCQ